MTGRADTSVVPHDHLVQFYDHECDLVDLVCGYLGDGLRAGETALVVATPEHVRAFSSAMADAGLDVRAALADRRLIVLDAAETLARFMTAEGPDPAAYDATIGALIRELASNGRPVRAYGEMVALLWDARQVVAAIELERLWNDLARRVRFSLLCAYPSASVAGAENSDQLQDVCRLHSSVVGSGSELRGPVVLAPGEETAARRFGATVDAARAARRFVVETLAGWGHGDVTADAALVVTELATNAVVHADSDFVVEVTRSAASVRIAVKDAVVVGPWLRARSSTAESGRGLSLVAAVATRWGHHPVNGGKSVWAELLV